MTGLEPATSGVTGRCSNQLSYIPLNRRDQILRLEDAVVKDTVERTTKTSARIARRKK